MTNQGSPTVRRRILASELKRLRRQAGLTQQQAEEQSGLGRASLSRYESCTSSISVPAADKLLTIYGVRGDHFDALLALAKGARSRGWLRDYKGVVPRWFEDLIALERDASTIHELGSRVVPGLLQTPDYARAVLSAGILGLDVDEQVEARTSRATLLDTDKPPEYWVVLNEAALHCMVGGSEVLRAQLRHLAEMMQRPNITVQILPEEAGAHPSMTTPFNMLGFDLAPDFAVVYLDYLTGSLYLDDPAEVDQYRRAFRHLIKQALPEKPSLKLITDRAKEL